MRRRGETGTIVLDNGRETDRGLAIIPQPRVSRSAKKCRGQVSSRIAITRRLAGIFHVSALRKASILCKDFYENVSPVRFQFRHHSRGFQIYRFVDYDIFFKPLNRPLFRMPNLRV